MRDFKLQINKDILNTPTEDLERTNAEQDEALTKMLKISDEILRVFADNKTTMFDAYMILTSIADSIYIYANDLENL